VRNLSGPLAIGGYVRNQPDGSVEAELEGDLASIDELVRALHEEHPLARIDQVDRLEVPVRGSRPPVQVY
jgi:acylphosphatase